MGLAGLLLLGCPVLCPPPALLTNAYLPTGRHLVPPACRLVDIEGLACGPPPPSRRRRLLLPLLVVGAALGAAQLAALVLAAHRWLRGRAAAVQEARVQAAEADMEEARVAVLGLGT